MSERTLQSPVNQPRVGWVVFGWLVDRDRGSAENRPSVFHETYEWPSYWAVLDGVFLSLDAISFPSSDSTP